MEVLNRVKRGNMKPHPGYHDVGGKINESEISPPHDMGNIMIVQ